MIYGKKFRTNDALHRLYVMPPISTLSVEKTLEFIQLSYIENNKRPGSYPQVPIFVDSTWETSSPISKPEETAEQKKP